MWTLNQTMLGPAIFLVPDVSLWDADFDAIDATDDGPVWHEVRSAPTPLAPRRWRLRPLRVGSEALR